MKKGIIWFIILILVAAISTFTYLKINDSTKNEGLVKINVAEVTHSIFYAPWYVAIEKGYFKDEGININLILTPGADNVAAAVLSNDVQIGFAGAESAIYVYNGGEKDYLKVFAGLTQRDGQFIVSRNEIKDFKPEDLIGKEVLVGRIGGMPFLNFENGLLNENIDKTKVKMNSSVDFADLTSAFISGSGDFVNLFEPNATKLEKEKLGYVVGAVGTYSGEVPYTTFYARKSYVEKNKDQLKKFNNALNKGLEFVKKEEPKKIAEAIAKQFPDSSLNDLTTMVKRYKDVDSWQDTVEIKESQFENLLTIMKNANMLKKDVPFKTIIW